MEQVKGESWKEEEAKGRNDAELGPLTSCGVGGQEREEGQTCTTGHHKGEQPFVDQHAKDNEPTKPQEASIATHAKPAKIMAEMATAPKATARAERASNGKASEERSRHQKKTR